MAYGYSIKKVHNILFSDAGQFYVKNKMAAEIKICETFSGNSLKEDLSIDTVATGKSEQVPSFETI